MEIFAGYFKVPLANVVCNGLVSMRMRLRDSVLTFSTTSFEHYVTVKSLQESVPSSLVGSSTGRSVVA